MKCRVRVTYDNTLNRNHEPCSLLFWFVLFSYSFSSGHLFPLLLFFLTPVLASVLLLFFLYSSSIFFSILYSVLFSFLYSCSLHFSIDFNCQFFPLLSFFSFLLPSHPYSIDNTDWKGMKLTSFLMWLMTCHDMKYIIFSFIFELWIWLVLLHLLSAILLLHFFFIIAIFIRTVVPHTIIQYYSILHLFTLLVFFSFFRFFFLTLSVLSSSAL